MFPKCGVFAVSLAFLLFLYLQGLLTVQWTMMPYVVAIPIVQRWATAASHQQPLRHHSKRFMFFFSFSGSKILLIVFSIFWVLTKDPSFFFVQMRTADCFEFLLLFLFVLHDPLVSLLALTSMHRNDCSKSGFPLFHFFPAEQRAQLNFIAFSRRAQRAVGAPAYVHQFPNKRFYHRSC